MGVVAQLHMISMKYIAILVNKWEICELAPNQAYHHHSENYSFIFFYKFEENHYNSLI